jgi:hypothetical protein
MDENKPTREGNSQQTSWYPAVAELLRRIGLHTGGLEPMDEGWHRTTIASNRFANGLCGNSFWLAILPSGCFLGTWGGCIYRLPDVQRLPELCVEWFQLYPHECRSHFDDRFAERFGLITVSESDFDRFVE